ncbi:UDP-glycosyltransferase 74F1 [Apostasia shenzhenica]|uniref:Glycosyltransferase n=1 Tax=Apostasia shenzhenica TaxID=1088818 RepID=A0A2I0B1B0_9ASPA|nr:UDP-glycosyltransferase 74F1 [Apostasia shenzhenica]
MTMEERESSGHALIVPYPTQGHINPMLQFAKRIAAHGLRVTAALTRFIANTTSPPPAAAASGIAFATISDGFDSGGFSEASGIPTYLAGLESAGARTLGELLGSLAAGGQPVTVVVYDSFLPWAAGVAQRHGAAAASFFTQSVAVNAAYCHLWEGRLRLPVTAAVEGLPGLLRMEPEELPSFFTESAAPYAVYLELVLNQFKDLEKADFMLINSFYELEPMATDWLKTTRPARTIGPTVPSAYLDGRIPGDSTYGVQLLPPETSACTAWLAARPPLSAVYVSFGSIAEISAAQTAELAHGLAAAGRPFLWVVRPSEASKLPPGFATGAAAAGGLVVGWAPQLEVLASGAVGCFVTHCGWNSTAEALVAGVPMVTVAQWTDQPTDAKYVEEEWGVGVRARKGEGGLVGRAEVERCVREVMEGERSEGMRRRAAEWKEAARRAVAAGGSSDRNVVEFVERYR